MAKSHEEFYGSTTIKRQPQAPANKLSAGHDSPRGAGPVYKGNAGHGMTSSIGTQRQRQAGPNKVSAGHETGKGAVRAGNADHNVTQSAGGKKTKKY